MSNTFRKPSHKLFPNLKKVKDGTRTRVSSGCENNGGCPYCKSNKLHKHYKNIININNLLDND